MTLDEIKKRIDLFFYVLAFLQSTFSAQQSEEMLDALSVGFVFVCCWNVLSTILFFSPLTIAVKGDKPDEQRPSLPEARRAQSLYRCTLQRPAQRVHPWRWQKLRGL